MSRKDELLKIANGNELAKELVNEIIYIEKQLAEAKKLPFIVFNPNNKNQQRSTPAAKLYKELMQQYNTSIKTLARVTGQNEKDEDSPLRAWVRKKTGSDLDD